MSGHKTGTVDSSQTTVKAGCGIRYDPDVLGDESGFDFSNAANLKPDHNEAHQQDSSNEESKNKPS